MTDIGLPSFLDDFTLPDDHSSNHIMNRFYDDYPNDEDNDKISTAAVFQDLLDLDMLQKNRQSASASFSNTAYPSPSSTESMFLDSLETVDTIDSLGPSTFSYSNSSLMMHASPESSMSSPTFYDLDTVTAVAAAAAAASAYSNHDNNNELVNPTSQDFPADFDCSIFSENSLLSDPSTTDNMDLLLTNPMPTANLLHLASTANSTTPSSTITPDQISSHIPIAAKLPTSLSSTTASANASSAASPASPKPLRKQSESRISLPELYIRMGLGHDHEEARTREQRILGILRAEGFKLGEKTWIRDTTEHERRRIIDTIVAQTVGDYGYQKELIEVIVRRGSYYLMQGRLRRIRRGKKAMENNLIRLQQQQRQQRQQLLS